MWLNFTCHTMNFKRTILYLFFIVLFFMLSLSLLSCGDNTPLDLFKSGFVDEASFQSRSSQRFQPINERDSTFISRNLKDIPFNVNYTYQLHKHLPIWIDKKGLKKGTKEILNRIAQLEDEGIHITDEKNQIANLLRKLENEQGIDVDTLLDWDRTLTGFYLTAARELLLGRDFDHVDDQWFVENDSFFFAPHYLAGWDSDSFPSFDTFRSDIPEYTMILEEIAFWKALTQDQQYISVKNNFKTDSSLMFLIDKECRGYDDDADTLPANPGKIAAYQEFFGLKKSGKLDEFTTLMLQTKPEEHIRTLQVNLNRLRRLPRDLGPHYVWVNIPLMELGYFRDKKQRFHSRVIVGKKARPTPSISSPMTNIVFNPPWGVPPTILKNDVGPGVARRGGSYLAGKGLRAYDARGRDVTHLVNGSNYRKYTISQPPGARNALGEIKFNMPNREAIYIHDTPNRGQFASNYRALSSGCVRAENPRQLAELILGTDSFSLNNIDQIISTRRTRSKNLDQKIPVYIIYLTVAPNTKGPGIRYLPDIYGRDKKMLKS